MNLKTSASPAASETGYRGSAPETVRGWFEARGWTPFEFQEAAWGAYRDRHSGLIHAPTGIGKTYAAWFGPIMEWLAEPPGPAPNDRHSAPPLRVLWITPLRALAADIHRALAETVQDLGLSWTVECRTGDTAASVRRRQKKRLPTALITTPESLHLLLSYPGARNRFSGLRAVVIDEWHELMGSKRGVLAELALARLKVHQSRTRIWGLSATLGNTETALQVLLGDSAADGRLIQGLMPKNLVIESILPREMERFPWAGHLGLRLLDSVAARIEAAGSSLVFTNTRSQCEIWFQSILDARPDWAGRLALHHGSLDRRDRDAVEAGLRSGVLKAAICTSSLDLGVDFSPVDLVIQIGSPKGIARLMQRAGRSGHRPGVPSRVVCVPTSALELMETAAAREAARRGCIEPREPVLLPLDVLAQYLVTAALGDGFEPDAIYEEVIRTHAFAGLTRRDFDWVLNFVSTGGASLTAYPAYRKIESKGGRYTVVDKTIAARHRMNIGTITGDAALQVKYLGGRRLGMVEERFISRLKPGDIFVFAGRKLAFVRVRDMTVWVRKSRSSQGPIPQWLGGRMALSTELAAAVRDQLDRSARGRPESPEMAALAPILDLQGRWSVIPGPEDLLIETCTSREGHHLFIFPFEGHLINEGLGALLAYRLSKTRPLSLSIAVNDYGLELLSDREIPLHPFEDRSVFRTDRLLSDILESVNAAEMGRRQFREIARVAGLVFQGYPGRRKSSGQIQASSSLLYNVFERYEPDNLLLRQSTREVLERQLEFRRLSHSLERMGKARLRMIATGRFTPLAFPIMVNRLRSRISSEELADRVKRMQAVLEKKRVDRGGR